jgi:predicted nucleic acid-binding protein
MPDEHDAGSEQLLDLVTDEGALVPSLWPLEIANALLFGVRRNRVSRTHCERALKSLVRLPIEIDTETTGRAWGPTFELAVRFGLTIYDATYLELAQRRELPLASLDRKLRAASRALGLSLLGV